MSPSVWLPASVLPVLAAVELAAHGDARGSLAKIASVVEIKNGGDVIQPEKTYQTGLQSAGPNVRPRADRGADEQPHHGERRVLRRHFQRPSGGAHLHERPRQAPAAIGRDNQKHAAFDLDRERKGRDRGTDLQKHGAQRQKLRQEREATRA
jgi:hypothetical protein